MLRIFWNFAIGENVCVVVLLWQINSHFSGEMKSRKKKENKKKRTRKELEFILGKKV